MNEPNRPTRGERPAKQSTTASPTAVAKHTIGIRAERYLVSPVGPVNGDRTLAQLNEDHDVKVLHVIESPAEAGLASPPIAAVETSAEHAAAMVGSAHVYVEVDQPLRYGAATLPYADPGTASNVDSLDFVVQAQSSDGEHLADAAVHVLADHPTQAVTGADGRVTMSVAAEDRTAIAGLYVRPKSDHWSTWLARPWLSTKEPNRVVCRKLNPGSVEQWSRHAMGFDRLPPNFRGHGVKVAIIDSGVAAGHTDLTKRLHGGHDFVAGDSKSWREDTLGYGTAIAGVLVANANTSGVAGLAPEVELHICKIAPGGHFGDLVKALNYCIAEKIDIAVLGVGSSYPSWLVTRKIEEARQAGVACVAAAGSTTGNVAFPAMLPTVLSVAAVGKLGTFPLDSYHITQLSGTPTPEGFFSARFNAYGPEIDVCAPGVGVISLLPPSSIGVLDGTAIAAAHVAALGALVLAHHPEFRDGYRVRGSSRVDRLLQIIRTSCRPLPHLDPFRIGAGLPDAVVALGLIPGSVHQSFAADQMITPPQIGLQPPDFNALQVAMRSAGLMPESPAKAATT